MQVKEVLSLAAALVGRDDLAAEAENSDPYLDEEMKLLLKCYNIIENEIAIDYFPLKRKECFVPEEGVVYFSEFSRRPVFVSSVEEEGTARAYRLFPDRIELSERAGEVTIVYAFAPEEKGIKEDSDFSGKVSARLMAFGVAAEFCLSRGLYPEASAFEGKYHDALRAANIFRRKLRLRARRWA